MVRRSYRCVCLILTLRVVMVLISVYSYRLFFRGLSVSDVVLVFSYGFRGEL